jgi:hypothetical protein
MPRLPGRHLTRLAAVPSNYTNKYDNQRQHQVHLALGRLLRRAGDANLPVIQWRVSAGLQVPLIGIVHQSFMSRDERLACYEKWCAFFDGYLKHEGDIGFSGTKVSKHARVKDVPWLKGHELLLRVELD